MRWSLLLGTISMAAFSVLLVTGVVLMFFYDPSSDTVVYKGSYYPLQGVEVSRAFSSLLHLSLEVRGGLLVRQAHHWAALILPASLMLQMLTVFFTGGFRRPRQWSWVLLCLVFLLTLAAGWSGYALPDDLLSGTGLRIFQGILVGVPGIGSDLSFLVFGGEFPGSIISRLYWLHVLLLPIGLALVLAARARIDVKHRLVHPFIGAVRALKAGMFTITVGVITLMAGTLTISPIWLYGPASSNYASAGSQPDWYTGFLDGALRLMPSGWEVEWLGGTWPLAVLIPQAVVAAFLTILVLLPFIDGWVNGRQPYQALDRPRNAPVRTGFGVAGLVFYLVLFGAAGSDVIATRMQIAYEIQVALLQVGLVLGPVVAFELTRRICWALQAHDADVALHGVETGRIHRLPSGGYVEERSPVSPAERRRLLGLSELGAEPSSDAGTDELEGGARRAS
jgi:ubiquinol-cytochrome c reductase cytochrome b subunit